VAGKRVGEAAGKSEANQVLEKVGEKAAGNKSLIIAERTASATMNAGTDPLS
jgi:hypothetical protein